VAKTRWQQVAGTMDKGIDLPIRTENKRGRLGQRGEKESQKAFDSDRRRETRPIGA